MNPATFVLAFTRFPVPGRAKTRLIDKIGASGAALLHRRMTDCTFGMVRHFAASSETRPVGIRVCYSGAGRKQFRAWLGKDLEYASQASGNIGNRMAEAFRSVFRNSAEYAVAVGTDIPDLSPSILQKALAGLQNHDIVLGPAADGGYYLIGMKCLHRKLFAGIDWGTHRVCEQTINIIQHHGWSVLLLDRLQDVDRPEDLPILRRDARFDTVFGVKPRVSVIIPTYNEEATIGRTLENLSNQDHTEIIVSDGGSSDRTRNIAKEFGAVVLEVPSGRAAQLNAGAAAAEGELLLFLHADTIPPSDFSDLIRAALQDPCTVAGAFRFRTDSGRLSMRLIEKSAHIRSSLFQWPYGDQGLFLEKRVFQEEGEFTGLPIMEDLELVSRLRRRGRIVTLKQPAVTSSRRWQRLGVLRTTLINLLMAAGFIGKVPISRLEQFYRSAGKRSLKETNPI